MYVHLFIRALQLLKMWEEIPLTDDIIWTKVQVTDQTYLLMYWFTIYDLHMITHTLRMLYVVETSVTCQSSISNLDLQTELGKKGLLHLQSYTFYYNFES